MRVVFANSGCENLSVEVLSAYLKSKGHETYLVFDPTVFSGASGREIAFLAKMFDMSSAKLARKALEYDPDVAAFSCVTGTYRWALDVAREIKALKNIPTIFGGIHPTALPEQVISENLVDAIVIGEGDHALEEIVSSIKDGVIQNLSVKNAWIKRNGVVHKNPIRPYIRDLDALPFPDKELFYSKVPSLERNYLILTSRGCSFKCSFCCHNLYVKLYNEEKNHVRRRTVDNVIKELQIVRNRGVAQYIEFWDDIFSIHKKWLREFAPKYRREIGLPFLCLVHPKFVDEEIVDLLAQAGCETVKMGVQTLDEKTLKEVLNRPGGEKELRKAAHLLADRKINFVLEHILGLPGEGLKQLDEAARVYADIPAKKYNNYWLVYYPGMEIIRISKEMGTIDEKTAAACE